MFDWFSLTCLLRVPDLRGRHFTKVEKTGISLKVDGTEDATKMHFQGQDVGVPDALELN